MTPEQLHTDLGTMWQWLQELSGSRTSVVVGLVCMDTQALQRVALPVVARVHRWVCCHFSALRHSAVVLLEA